MDKLVSIIVPVYNVEKFLDKCIESIIKQTYKNIEILCINDGSTDGCSDILDKWGNKDERVKVIHKENGGLISVRRLGAKTANGEYLAFIDSDDYVKEDMIELLLKSALEAKSDIAVAGFETVDENGKPLRLEAVVLSTQHDEEVTQEQIHADIKKYVFDEILPAEMVDAETKFFINPTGRFVIGGPHGDAGLTGRKIIVDTYGGYARHGGGAFSGKDCTKVDRSAAYAARYVAKNIVAAGLADKCEIQLSYAIGVAQPTSVMVDTFGTGKIADDELVKIVRENFDLRPAGIIKMLDLRRPIYRQTAAYGHFGRNDLNLPWEATNKAEALKKYL